MQVYLRVSKMAGMQVKGSLRAWCQVNASCYDYGHSVATQAPLSTHPALLLSSAPTICSPGVGEHPSFAVL